MDKGYIVKKSNYFIMNCSYDLSLAEQKIILTLASMVQPEDEDFKSYKFRISDFMKLIGVDDKSKYTEIPKITKELMKKVFEIQDGNKLIQTAWLSGAIYEKGSGEVELTFSSYLKPYMLKLNTMFTQYKLANILSMKSKYSPRIYELLKCNEYKKQGYIEIELIDLRHLLKTEDIYPRYYDFKRFVLEASQKELNKLSDISFDFEEIKTGRKVTSIKFYIHSVKKFEESAEPDEIAISSIENEKRSEDIKSIVELMSEQHIEPIEAVKIYKSANYDMANIKKVYSYFKDKKADNFVGLMIRMVKPGEFNEPKENSKKLKFNNYKQRNYDYDELEKKLLGWENNND